MGNVATIGRRPRFTPPANARVDWSHPLAPVGGWGAVPAMGVDLYGRRPAIDAGFGGLTGRTAYGPAGTTTSATTAGLVYPVPRHMYVNMSAATLVFVGSVDAVTAANNMILLVADGNTGVAPYIVMAMYNEGATNSLNVGVRDQTGTFSALNTTGGGGVIANGAPAGLGVIQHATAINAATRAVTYYRDGLVFGSSTLGTGVTGISWPSASAGIGVLGAADSTSQGTQGSCVAAFIYPRLLSAAEIGSLYADPFQMLVW